jgi:hypothetical protein
MNKERLQTLATFLKKVPSNKFDLGHWRVHVDNEDGPPVTDLNECGTTACAIGWACSIPEFIEAGLVYKEWGPTFDGHVSWGAPIEFFGISRKVANLLFSAHAYSANASARTVADRIETVISI